MTSELEKLSLLDEHLVCAMVAGRKRLGILGVVSLTAFNGESQNHVMFYDFVHNEQEPLMPVGVIQSTQEIVQIFGLWDSFFEFAPDFSDWIKQINTQQTVSPLSVARAYLCSTGKLQLPDSEALVQMTSNQQIQGRPLGFDMSPELAESWLHWAIQEDENSRNYSRARKLLSQAIADEVNRA